MLCSLKYPEKSQLILQILQVLYRVCNRFLTLAPRSIVIICMNQCQGCMQLFYSKETICLFRIRQRTKKEDCRWEIYERSYFPWIEVEDLRTVIIFIREHYSKDFGLVFLRTRTTFNPPLLTKWCEGRANGNQHQEWRRCQRKSQSNMVAFCGNGGSLYHHRVI